MRKNIIKWSEITIGVILMSIGYYFFLEPSNLVTGGIMGITIMVKNVIPFEPSILILILNIILLIIGYIFLGKELAYKTVYASLLSPVIIFILEKTAPQDVFLRGVDPSNIYFISMIASSLLIALGLGLCFKNDSTTGGMDIVQKILHKYLHVPFSTSMHLTDTVVILISGFFITQNGAFYGIEGVVYGLIAVVIVGYFVDIIALNAKNRKTAYIITTKPQEIKEMIFSLVGRGVTECDVRGGYTMEDKVMLICTLETKEAYKIKEEIFKIDPNAFTFMSQTKEVIGDFE